MKDFAVISVFAFLIVSSVSLIFVGILILWDMVAGNYEPDFSFRSFRSLVHGFFKKG
jgi:hypothetical protein